MAIKQHLNCSKLAKLLDVDTRTLRNWACDADDPIPAYKIKGVWLFEVQAVEKWLEQKNTTVATEAMVDELLNTL